MTTELQPWDSYHRAAEIYLMREVFALIQRRGDTEEVPITFERPLLP